MTDMLKENFEKRFTNKYSIPPSKGRNPFLMFDCDGGAVNMPFEELKHFIRTEIERALRAVVPVEDSDQNYNSDESQGWFNCRTELLANIDKYLKEL